MWVVVMSLGEVTPAHLNSPEILPGLPLPASDRSSTPEPSPTSLAPPTTTSTGTPGPGLHTPASVHFGTAGQIREQRAITLAAAYAAHSERFARRPIPPEIPLVAWISEPTTAIAQAT